MKHFIKSLLLLLSCCSLLSLSASGAPVNRAEHAIPSRLEALSKKKDAIPHPGTHDSNAFIYYVYHIDCTQGNNYSATRFATETGFMTEAHKKLAGSGAELLMHITPGAAHTGRNAGKLAPALERMAAQAGITCPVLNNGHKQIRKIFFQNAADASTIKRLRVIDSNGRLLAYFSKLNDSIIMYDTVLNTRKVLKKYTGPHNQWEADAILSSREQLLSQARRNELAEKARAKTQARTAATQKADKPRPAAAKNKKTARPTATKKTAAPQEDDDFAADADEDDEDFLEEDE